MHPLIVRQSGNGRLLTLVHGWAMHGGVFPDWSSDPGRWRINRIDLPGHGHNLNLDWPTSSATLADSIAEAAGGGWLLGWSLGGLLALAAAQRGRHALRGLVLVAASPCFARRDHWPWGIETHWIDRLEQDLINEPAASLKRFIAQMTLGSACAGSQRRRLLQACRQADPVALRAALRVLRETDCSALLGTLDLPVLLIAGRRDRLIPCSGVKETARRLPNARLLIFDDAAHAPFLGHEHAMARAIDCWMDQTNQ